MTDINGRGAGVMPMGQLIRLSGLTLFLGAALWWLAETFWSVFVLSASDPSEYPQPLATILWITGLAAFICILLGLPGLYTVVSPRARTIGLIGFTVLFAGEVLVAGLWYYGAFLQRGVAELRVEAEAFGVTVEEPVMAVVGFLATYLLHILGWILLGVAALRAGVLPRWPVVLAMVGPLLGFMARALEDTLGTLALGTLFAALALVWAVGIAWLGVALARLGKKDDEAATMAESITGRR